MLSVLFHLVLKTEGGAHLPALSNPRHRSRVQADNSGRCWRGDHPEQLSAAGYAACFEPAIIQIKRRQTDKVCDETLMSPPALVWSTAPADPLA